jgi:hypothetical protein
MSKLSSLAAGAAIALTSIAFAHANPSASGNWKFSVGVNDDPCVVSLVADSGIDYAGPATATGDCNGVSFQRWKTSGRSLLLSQSNGTAIALLHAKGEAYEGKDVSDGRSVALNR